MNRTPTGLGIGLRAGFAEPLLAGDRHVDFLEIVPENFIGRGGRDRRLLEACAERWPVLAHGVSVSVGGPDPLDTTYLAALKELLDTLGVPFYTDHLCFTSLGGLQTHELLPLPACDEAVLHVAARVRELRDRLDRPVALENITEYAVMPGSTLDRGTFLARVCEEADCGMLLDVANVACNAANHGTDPFADLDRLPLHRAVQMHVAGSEERHGRVLDTHGAPVSPLVVELARTALHRIGHAIPVLLERDLALPPVAEVLDEADLLREALFGREEAACA